MKTQGPDLSRVFRRKGGQACGLVGRGLHSALGLLSSRTQTGSGSAHL